MMLDADVVAVSPASVWRVLKQAGLLSRWKAKPSRKGSGFEQPLQPHQHWHIDVSYINVCGTFYYLCSVLDGYSRSIVHWDLRESMRETDIEVILERAKEKYPEAKPRIISDNGPQFIARDFKEFIRISGMTHVRTSPYYPQSNGKIERWHKSLKSECIRPGTPLSLEDAQRLVQAYVEHYKPSPAWCRQSVPASPAPCRARPSRWLPTPWHSRSARCDSPPADCRCSSTSPPCPRPCAPTGPRDQSSTRASGWTVSRRESSPWDCRDHRKRAGSCQSLR